MLYTFFYHTISDEDLAFAKHLYPIKTTKQFEADLDFLLTNFEPPRLDELGKWKEIKKPTFLLTFDDGLRQVGEVIAPILLRKGIPAIFFVNKAFAKHEAVFYKHQISWVKEKLIRASSPERDYAIQKLASSSSRDDAENQNMSVQMDSWDDFGVVPRDDDAQKLLFEKYQIDLNQLKANDLYLSVNDLKSLSGNGFLIGGHSVDHPHFGEIPKKEQLWQVNESMKWVNENFNPSIGTFAFPFEDYFLKTAFYESMNQLEFAPQLTFGTSEGKEDVIANSIQRIDAEAGGLPLEVIFKKYQKKRFWRKLFFKNKLIR